MDFFYTDCPHAVFDRKDVVSQKDLRWFYSIQIFYLFFLITLFKVGY